MSRANACKMEAGRADYQQDGDLYGAGSAVYSPADYSPPGGLPALGLPQDVVNQDDPTSATSPIGTKGTSQVGDTPPPISYVVTVPRPPLPSTGGMPGRTRMLGWTTGMLPSRNYRQRFTGQVIVAPSQGVHPVEGPVGFSNRQGRLASGVAALVDQWLPSQQQVNQDVVNMNGTSLRNRNPLRDGITA
jgi:hypothetical protein